MPASRNQLLLNAFVRAAVLHGASVDKTPRVVLQEIILGKFNSEATNGRTVVTVSEGGGTTSFTLPEGLGPSDVMAMAEEAIELLNTFATPDSPDLTQLRRVTRLRPCFNGTIAT